VAYEGRFFEWYSPGYTTGYPTNRDHLYYLGVHTSLKASVCTKKIQVTSGTLLVYHERALHSFFIPCTGKENAVTDTINMTYVLAAQDGKVGGNTVEFTTDFLYSNWLFFHGMV